MGKRIIIIANNSGGLYCFRNELIDELVKQENSVMILTPFDTNIDDLKKLGVDMIETPIDRRSINPFKDLKLIGLYFRYLKKYNPDLVITYTIKPNVYAGFVCRLFRLSYSANITGLGTAFQNSGILRDIVKALYKSALKKAKIVFFENVENQQIFIDEKIVNERQTCLLNGAGVNLEHYSVAEYPQDDGMIRFLFIGRIMKEKGVNELFVAMELLREEGIMCILDVLGDYEEDYTDTIKKYKMAGWLNYYGYQKDVRPYIAKSHCFVLPSWHEGMANTNLECAAMGRPVITTNIHGCMEAVENGVSGYLCEKRNVMSLYEVMKQFTRLSATQRKLMGLSGRKHMEKMFDKKKVIETTINALGLKEKE